MSVLRRKADFLQQKSQANPDYFSSNRPKKISNLSMGQTQKNFSLDGMPNIKSPQQQSNKIMGAIQSPDREKTSQLQQNLESSPALSSKTFRLDRRKRSEGFSAIKPTLNSPERLPLHTDRGGLLSTTLSPRQFKQGILQSQNALSPKAKNLLLSPNTSCLGLDENTANSQKNSTKLVKQLRDAIKRTKYNALEDQLNLEEQKQLEHKIKNDLLPQMLKMQELNSGDKHREGSYSSIHNRVGFVKQNSKAHYSQFDRKYSSQLINISGDNSPAIIPKKQMPTKDEISIELLMIIKFLQNRQEYLQTLKYMNKEQSMEKLTDLLRLATELDDIDLFLDAMDMIVQTSIMFSDYRLSLIVLNMMKTTCEMNHNVIKRITLYRNYAQVCKRLGYYDDALRFLKKSLQYIWLEDDKDQEIQIYDDLGLVFFHLVQLDQAKNFHEKSVQSFNEPIDNILREMSSRNVQKHINSFYPQTKTIDHTLLMKLLQFPFIIQKRDASEGPIDLHIENNYLKKNNLRLVKKLQQMSSQLSEQYMIQQVLQSSEFQDEISTPLSKPIEFSPLDFVRMKKVNDHFVCIEEKELKKGKSQPKFVFPKSIKKTENTTFYLEDDKKKMDLDDKVKFRIKQLDQDLKKKNKIQGASAESMIIRKENLETINIGHLTTNRNVEAFTSAVSINYQLPNKFYDKMISNQFNKHNNMQINQSNPHANTSKERNS